VADCFYGDNPGFTDALGAAGVPFVLALKPRKGTWAPAEAAHTPVEAAGELSWHSPNRPGQWRRIQRRFRDGHTETWWAADATLGGWGPERRLRLVVATTDPASLPGPSSWYLLTSDRAIRRHWTLVCCAFSFCWQAFLADHPTLPTPPGLQADTPSAARGAQATGHRRRTRRQVLLAGGVAGGAGLADPLERAAALLAVVVASAATPAAATAA
jgi:hypothetical protein